VKIFLDNFTKACIDSVKHTSSTTFANQPRNTRDFEAYKDCNWNIEVQQKMEKWRSPAYNFEPHEIQIIDNVPIN